MNSIDDPQGLVRRIRGEYCEMPGLTLTLAQASRLWHVDPASVEPLLEDLVAEGLLRRSTRGAYHVRSESRSS